MQAARNRRTSPREGRMTTRNEVSRRTTSGDSPSRRFGSIVDEGVIVSVNW